MNVVTVDLSLARTHTNGYAADLRVLLPGNPTPVTPLAAPAPVRFDQERLRSLALDPSAYGAALSAMLFASQPLHTAFAQARAVVAQRATPLRLCLTIQPSAEELHALRWECLADPEMPEQPLAATTHVLLSRVLPCADWQPLPDPPSGRLRSLALVAAPRDLPDYDLSPIAAAQEIAQFRAHLGGSDLCVLGDDMPATLDALLGRLHSGCDLLFLLAHGRCDEEGQTWLYLEDDAGDTAPVPGGILVDRIAALAEKPRLVILACCESAGDGNSVALAAIGPQLVRAGVPAVLAMQGRISQTTLARFIPALLQALLEDGRIDRAVARARSLVRDRPDWWGPALWMREGGGLLWAVTAPAVEVQALHQLRAPVADFVGRDETLAELVAALRAGRTGCAAAISGVRGMGGVGKTELAHAVAAQLRADYPDAQLLLELGGAGDTPLSPEQALQQLIRAFCPEDKLPDDLSALVKLYRSVLSGRRALILADDARDVAQIRPLLPPLGCALLVTSRQRFALDGMAAFDLGRLDPGAAVALLRGICARLTDEQARQIARLCGYLPLALRVSAGILLNDEALPVERYLARLADERRRMAHLKDPDDPARDVQAILLLSYAALDARTQTHFRRLGALAADADLPLVAALLELPEDEADEVLRMLLRRSLVEYDPARQRWGLHDLVRACALDLLVQTGEERAARLHYAEQVVGLIQQADRRYQGGGEGVLAGLALFDRERAHLEAVRAWLWAEQSTPEIDRLVVAEASATANFGTLRDPLRRVRMPQLERALTAAQQQRDRVSEGCFQIHLGHSYRDLGEVGRSFGCYEQALAIARERGDRQSEGTALSNLGNACLSRGEPSLALGFYQQHQTLAQAIGDRRGEGCALSNLGNVYWTLGEVGRSIGYYEQALAITRERGDRQCEGSVLGNLGAALHVLGQIKQARDCYGQHLAVARELGDRQGQGRALGNLGEVSAELGDLVQALEHYSQALLLLREVGDRRNECYLLTQVASVCLRRSEQDAALAHSRAALALARETGDRRLEAVAMLTSADAHAALSQSAKAIGDYADALAVFDALGCAGDAARTRWAYGLFLLAQDKRETGLALMAECVAYEQQIGHPQAAEHATLVADLRCELEVPLAALRRSLIHEI
ncbi:MAG TPA: tetratricopeptide repeat protein [Roseiflexaceae bacterium]|nr:tetratricopeptide repeat protein [Roseiflexaceae bacterium]